jgi:hypothetical protein
MFLVTVLRGDRGIDESPGQLVTHTVTLRAEVTDVDVSDPDNERNEFRHLDAVLDELPALFRIVGQKSNRRNS